MSKKVDVGSLLIVTNPFNCESSVHLLYPPNCHKSELRHFNAIVIKSDPVMTLLYWQHDLAYEWVHTSEFIFSRNVEIEC